ncbi:MAG: peptidylprolyl isomerase [Candidatus Marinimicrobia bacterium]|nr:peptidylprolyl isomerase [Candidatus Neomarinimicrobiota bacterium]
MSQQWNKPPELKIDTDNNYTAEVVTNRGSMTLELSANHAPKTVNNFVFLAREGYYNNVKFHRVIDNFMVQGGDPTGTGMGGPGYQFEDEFAHNPLRHVDNVISMANAGPGTNGSQFFITHGSTPHLDGRHTVFGKLTAGLDVLNSIRQDDVMEQVIITEN